MARNQRKYNTEYKVQAVKLSNERKQRSNDCCEYLSTNIDKIKMR